jgi:hypothetical protein
MADVTPIEKKEEVPQPNYIGRRFCRRRIVRWESRLKEPALFRSCILRDIYMCYKERGFLGLGRITDKP